MPAFILGGIIGFLIGAAIGAIFLRWATRIAAGFTPAFGRAYGAVLISGVVSWLIGFVIGRYFVTIGRTPQIQELSVVVFLPLLAQWAILAHLLQYPDGRRLGYGKALLTMLVLMLFAIVIGGIFWVVIQMLGGM